MLCRGDKDKDKSLSMEVTRTRVNHQAKEKSQRLAAGAAERKVIISLTAILQRKKRRVQLEDQVPTAS